MGHEHDLLIGSSAEEASIFARLSGLDEKSAFYRRADRIIRLAGTSWDALRKVYGELDSSLTIGEIDLLIMGEPSLTWWVIPIMLFVGFITPWPYNYWRLKKYGLACH